MVFNHFSKNHEWFQRALNGDEKFLNYFIFKDGEPDKPPKNWISKFGGNSWEYIPHLKNNFIKIFAKKSSALHGG